MRRGVFHLHLKDLHLELDTSYLFVLHYFHCNILKGTIPYFSRHRGTKEYLESEVPFGRRCSIS